VQELVFESLGMLNWNEAHNEIANVMYCTLFVEQGEAVGQVSQEVLSDCRYSLGLTDGSANVTAVAPFD
jgi:hypothetical protein